jgi:anti-sigma regulatory factor (Ser/Thr protein kinase)
METPISVTESSQVSEARRHAMLVAQNSGFSESLQSRAALVMTEAATNLVKYGRDGYVLVRPYPEPAGRGLEILALDRGPGIAHLGQSVSDGFSTGGSLGVGLGAISRLSSRFDIYTTGSAGTAILARLDDPPQAGAWPPSRSALEVGGLSTAKVGQESCGDAWSSRWVRGAFWVAAVDGLGHGPQAATAALEAMRVFHQGGPESTPYDILRAAHQALKHTRGAVMAVAVIRPVLGTMEFAGVGNIAAALIQDQGQRRLPSMDGIVGYSIRAIREQSYTWTPSSMLILASDGLSSRWNLGADQALASRHPSLVAGVLHRDFSRSGDDATVVVVKGCGP